MDNQEKLERAKAYLVLSHTFFASGVMRRKIILSDKVPTAGVTVTGTIYINPDFLQGLTVRNTVFLLAHEAMHYLFLHGLRRGSRDFARWNVACDMVINETLKENKVGDPIYPGCFRPGAHLLCAEDVYEECRGDEGGGSGGIGHDIVEGEGTESERVEAEAQARIELSQALTAAKQRGAIPAGMERLVDRTLHPHTPWHRILQNWFSGFAKDETTWSRPAKRFAHLGIYLPSTGTVPTMGEAVLVIDTSGSIGAEELSLFQGHMNRILETCLPEKLHVVYCDARVGSVDEYMPDDYPAKFRTPTGGGGTDLRKAFRWVEEQGLEPDCIVVLTDGYTPFDDTPSVFPTAWLMTSDVTPPWGVTVRVER